MFNFELKSLAVPQFIKNKLVEDAFNKHKFYLFLPIELAKLYPNTEDNKIKIFQLTFYSYLYFSSFLSFDKYYDGQSENSTYRDYLIYYMFYIKEASLFGLTKLFGVESIFWTKFRNLKDYYFNATRKSKKINYKEWTLSDYKNLAKEKSILSYAYVIALDCLLGENKNTHKIIEVLNEFHLGFQIYDDYKDIQEDINNQQINYFHWLMSLKTDNNEILDKKSFTFLLKKLYVDESISNGLNLSLKHFNRSKEIANELGLINIIKVIDDLSLEIKGELHYIGAAIQKTKDKSKRSNITILNNNLSLAAKLSLKFIENNLSSDFTWNDFLTNAGYGKEWITGYVLCMIGEVDTTRDLFQKPLEIVLKRGGGYSSSIVNDADSMNFYIKVSLIYGKEIAEEKIKKWLLFSHENGGWATYYDEDIKISMRLPLDSDFKGWYTPQVCVTAVSAWTMIGLKNNAIERKYDRTIDFLVKRQNENGSWSSYWWTSNIYATAYSILSLPKNGQYNKEISNAINYLIKEQKENGSWVDGNKESAFYTAIATKALLDFYVFDKRYDLIPYIKRAIDWLIENQMDDGSWQVTRILRIPAPNIINVDEVKIWGRSSFGLNCLVDDHNRIFTTSTVFNTLGQYGKLF